MSEPPRPLRPTAAPVDRAGPLPPGTVAHQALGQAAEQLRLAQRVPPAPFLCGLADGTLRQLLPPVAAEVGRRTRQSALARVEVARFWDVMTPYERLRALWRRLPLRCKLALALLCFVGCGVTSVDAVESHRQRTARHWRRYPGNAHWYFLGGTHDSLADVGRYSRRYGAYPAVVDDPGEHRWLASQFVVHQIPRSANQPPAPWVLLGYRERRRGQWQTVTGAPLRFSRWAPGEPAPTASQPGRVVVWRAETGWHAVPPPSGRPGSPSLMVLFEHPGDPYAWAVSELTRGPLLLLLGVLLTLHAAAVLAARRRVRGQFEQWGRSLDDWLQPTPRSDLSEVLW